MADTDPTPYTPVPNNMEKLFSEIPGLGRPDKVDQGWLKRQGYLSGNDKMTLSAMRKLGMIGSGSASTDFYEAIRTENKAAVAEHTRKAYRELFELYPHAEKKDDEALLAFFRSKTSKGQAVQRYMVRTFKVVCKFGDFEAAAPATTVPTREDGTEQKDERRARARQSSSVASGGLTLNVNIQLQLPPSSEGDVYDKLFEAMGKHLKGLATLE